MLRSSDHSAVTYTTDDLVLFRESPFAAWMERLTLENPDHGIIPDIDDAPAVSHTESLEDIVATLRAEGRNVAVISDEIETSERAISTEVAMRGGADFIVNAYLTEGSLAATAGLMMRTSGFSDLGDYLYIPCEARPLDLRHSSFRLCVLADLLQVAQGQLPPQMLIISGGADLTPLQTEDHIYYYRSVKARFLESMAEFRKHRMPDAAESTFFGRWSACAGEVLKQRAQRDLAHEGDEEQEQERQQDQEQDNKEEQEQQEQQQQQRLQQLQDETVIIEEIVVELPRVQVAGGAPQSFYSSDLETPRTAATPRIEEVVVATLAEQASMLKPDSFHSDRFPGHTPNLASIAPLRAVIVDKPAAVIAEVELDTSEAPTEARVEDLVGDLIDSIAAKADQGIIAADVEQPNLIGGEPGAVTVAEAEADLLQTKPVHDTPTRRTSDVALENLEFIGSGPAALMGREPLMDVTGPASSQMAQAPDATIGLRETFEPESPWPEPEKGRVSGRAVLPDLEPPEPVLLPPHPTLVDEATQLPRKPHPLDSQTPKRQSAAPASNSMIDMDSAPPPALSPVTVKQADASGLESELSSAMAPGITAGISGEIADTLARSVEQLGQADRSTVDSPLRQFSNSLQTGHEFEDTDEP